MSGNENLNTVKIEQLALAKRYLLYKTLTRMWFMGAVWLYFYRLFVTDLQVGFLDSISFAIGLIAEVPSGALADKYGRDKMVRLGQLLAAGGVVLQAIGESIVPLFIGQSLLMIGLAFVSGADEALFFHKIKFDRKSLEWRKLMTKSSQYGLAGSFVALVAGGYLHTINPRIPWMLTGAAFFFAALVIWPLHDEREKKKRLSFSKEIYNYVQTIKTGFGQFLLPKLKLYVPIIITVQGLHYLTGYGLLHGRSGR